jgi:hypothetical protein
MAAPFEGARASAEVDLTYAIPLSSAVRVSVLEQVLRALVYTLQQVPR